MSITLHMAVSLDGLVGKDDNDISWMEASWSNYPEGQELSAEHVAEVLSSIDCYIMGSKTYELALKLGWPYGDKQTLVVTKRKLTTDKKNVEFCSSDLPALAKNLENKKAWLVGGPVLCQEFLRLKLVDQICLTVFPIVLGKGVSLFGGSEHRLVLKEMTAFKNGMVDMWYDVLQG